MTFDWGWLTGLSAPCGIATLHNSTVSSRMVPRVIIKLTTTAPLYLPYDWERASAQDK